MRHSKSPGPRENTRSRVKNCDGSRTTVNDQIITVVFQRDTSRGSVGDVTTSQYQIQVTSWIESRSLYVTTQRVMQFISEKVFPIHF